MTYNIVSQGKTASLFAGGVFLFGDTFTELQLIGLLIAASGIFFYSRDNIQDSTHPPVQQIDEEIK